MENKTKMELWLRYTSVWRNVLTHVLKWPLDRANSYIEELRREKEATIDNPFDLGFFYDAPSRHLARPIIGNGLHERILGCKSDEANPALIWQRLVRAITGDANERDLEKSTFDWDQARDRYQLERDKIEKWLNMQEK
jgi:hypothetical protein